MAKDDCGHPVEPGAQVHVHGRVVAVGPELVTVEVCDKDGDPATAGQLVTCKPCCVHCDGGDHA